MKSLINYIKENQNKIVFKTPQDVLIILGDDLNRVWKNPDELWVRNKFSKKEFLKDFWNTFYCSNIMSNKHFKIFTPKLDFLDMLNQKGFAKTFVELANSKIKTDGQVRYLISTFEDKDEYKILCIDLLEHKYTLIWSNWGKTGVARCTVGEFKENDSVKDFPCHDVDIYDNIHYKAKIMLVSDEFYGKK